MREYRIDELAQTAGTTVRNIRSYQDRGLLPPPRLRGRVGIYDEAHLARLRLIGQMLERGYTLANIGDLIAAWEAGRDVGDVLGLEQVLTDPWSDEIPGWATREELAEHFGTERFDERLARAIDLGLIEPAEPTGTTTPAKPTGTTTPAEPAGTTALAEPAGTTAPAEPIGTTIQAEPTGTTALAEPIGTTAPAGPTGTTALAEPTGTTIPAEPTGTTAPAESARPARPAEPVGDRFRVPSPRLLHVGAELVASGIPLEAVLEIADEIRQDCEVIAGRFVDLVDGHVIRNADLMGEDAARVAEVIRRMRPLVQMVVNPFVARAMEQRVRAELGEKLELLLKNEPKNGPKNGPKNEPKDKKDEQESGDTSSN